MNRYGETFRAEAYWPGGFEPLGDFDSLEAAWAAVEAFREETDMKVRGRVRVIDAVGHEIDVL